MTLSCAHLGHTKPAMFSTTPMMGIWTLRQKETSFRTSSRDISWGVVSKIAPSEFNAPAKS